MKFWDFKTIFPSNEGEDLLAALENGVSMYPKLEGRFLQVGGLSFAFDPTKPPLQRVDRRFVRIGDQVLKLNHNIINIEHFNNIFYQVEPNEIKNWIDEWVNFKKKFTSWLLIILIFFYLFLTYQYLQMDAKYRMVTKAYMLAGKDGFDVLKKTKVLVRRENVDLSFLGGGDNFPNNFDRLHKFIQSIG